MYAYTRIGFAVIQSKIRRGVLNANVGQEETFNKNAKKNRKEKMNTLSQLKMSKSSFLIALCYLCCYMPALFFAAARANASINSLRALASPWCLLFVMLNSCLNSVIFFWRNASLRKETINVLQNIRKNVLRNEKCNNG